jgi:LysM repeat protein
MQKITLILLIVLFSLENAVAQKMTHEQYITKYKLIALQEMFEYKVPASITLAQGIFESGSGNSTLATEANNHFGIKCHSEWRGERVYHDDDAKQECFRKYERAEDSYRDHAVFLSGKKRYAALFELKITNYKGWAKGLKEAGYATNPKYPKRLIDLIERYNLDRFDKISKKEYEKMIKDAKADPNNKSIIPEEFDNKKKPSPTPTAPIAETPKAKAGYSTGYHDVNYHNRIKYIVTKKGDTPQKISEEFDVWLKQIYKFNDLKEGQKLKKGMVIYLQPKRRKGDVKYHVVQGGESLWDISQKHGIKLQWLLKRNHLKADSKIRRGQKLWLRKTMPKTKSSY